MSDLTYAEVVRILKLIDGAEGSDIDLTTGDLSIKVTRGGARVPRAIAPDMPKTQTSSPAQGTKAADTHPDASPVEAPMGGMFYASHAPGQAPFATAGQEVKAGDQLGIIEVMKLFTAITAPVDGTLVAILVEDQQTVAKDEVLMRIEVAE